ncbi:HNH endonuclease [Ewingella americana]|uniref:HNH endonuclease n=1 Tax=Ewingella americana TaxID=41202 RepID=UPI00112C835B|nr:hypothetical protein [Ewingella americana]
MSESPSLNEIAKFKRIVLERDNYTCQCCGVGLPKGSIFNSSELQVHHLNSQENYPEQRIDPKNGITLCINCHSDFHVWAEHIDYVTKEYFWEWLDLTYDRRTYWYLRIKLREKHRHTCQCCKGTWSQNKKLRIYHLTEWQYVNDSADYRIKWWDRHKAYHNSLVFCTVCDNDFPNWYVSYPPTPVELSKFLDSGQPSRKTTRVLIKILITLATIAGSGFFLMYVKYGANFLKYLF